MLAVEEGGEERPARVVEGGHRSRDATRVSVGVCARGCGFNSKRLIFKFKFNLNFAHDPMIACALTRDTRHLEIIHHTEETRRAA